MTTVDITNFRKNLFEYLNKIIKYNEPLSISTKEGNAVILSEDDYLGLMEILYLISTPVMEEKLVKAKYETLADCIPERNVKW